MNAHNLRPLVWAPLAIGLGLLAGCAGDSDGPPGTGVNAPSAPREEASQQGAPPSTRPPRPSLFVAEGAPDPLACETDGDCTRLSVPSDDGCCQSATIGSGALASAEYQVWLDAYRAEHCADVECPESAAWRQIPRCERQTLCWQSRCQTACDGIPDESALPFSEISFREAKRRAMVASTGEPHPPVAERQRCAARTLDDVIVLGSFRHDVGCHFMGAFVGERYFSDRREATVAYLEGYDWGAATARERETMARSLLSGLRHSMQSVRSVEIETQADGSINVEFDIQPPSRMRRARPQPQHHTFLIRADGRLR